MKTVLKGSQCEPPQRPYIYEFNVEKKGERAEYRPLSAINDVSLQREQKKDEY